jgi:hypothetical protein
VGRAAAVTGTHQPAKHIRQRDVVMLQHVKQSMALNGMRLQLPAAMFVSRRTASLTMHQLATEAVTEGKCK